MENAKSESHFLEGVSWKMQKVSLTFWKGFVENEKSELHFLEGFRLVENAKSELHFLEGFRGKCKK